MFIGNENILHRIKTYRDNSKSMLNLKLKSYNLFIFLCTDVCIFSYKCFMVACDKKKRYNYMQYPGERN